MNRAEKFRDDVISAWTSQPTFISSDGALSAIVQHDCGVLVPEHSKVTLRSASDANLAQLGAWLVETFGVQP